MKHDRYAANLALAIHLGELRPLAAIGVRREQLMRWMNLDETDAEVEDYFDTADQAEIDRVIAAEKASANPRKGVLDLAATQEGK